LIDTQGDGRAHVRRLKVGNWLGWAETPALSSEWGASPVYVTVVRPFPGGVSLGFVHLLHSVRAIKRRVELEIMQSEDTHLVGRFSGRGGEGRTAVIASPTLDWLGSWCPRLCSRFPAARYRGDGGAEGYLEKVFGRTADDMLGRSRREPQSRSPARLPDRVERLPYLRELGAFDSWVLARGGQVFAGGVEWRITMDRDLAIFRRPNDSHVTAVLWGVWRGDRFRSEELVIGIDSETDGDLSRRSETIVSALDALVIGYPPAPSQL
jgi:hypothetical protein